MNVSLHKFYLNIHFRGLVWSSSRDKIIQVRQQYDITQNRAIKKDIGLNLVK